MGAPTEYYIDPTVASDGGAGTSGSPWTRADGNVLQYALDNITRDTTNGDRINVKSGTPHTGATASLSFTSYGSSTYQTAVIIQGYTSTANDGGKGTILMNSLRDISSRSYLHFIDIIADTCRIKTATGSDVFDCEVRNVSSGDAIYIATTGHAAGNYVSISGSANGINNAAGGNEISCNVIEMADSSTGIGIRCGSNSLTVRNNIVKMGTGAATGISILGYNQRVANNSIYSNGGTGGGIYLNTGAEINNRIYSNLVEGFSGTGGHGIELSAGAYSSAYNISVYDNAVYNCDTAYYVKDDFVVQGGSTNETLSESPFTDAANGDFTPVDTGNVLSPQRTSTVNGIRVNAAKGAVAPASSGGGSTVIVIEDD